MLLESDVDLEDLVLLRALEHPDCPWEAAGRIQVDRFFAFAFRTGAGLRGIEPRTDALVRRLGGRREEPSAHGGSRLPYYRLPTRPRAEAASGRFRPGRHGART